MAEGRMSELRRLVHIANEFNRAAAFKYAGDAESVAKLQSAFSAEDLTRIVELQESLRDTALAVYRRGGTEAEAEEEMAPGWLMKSCSINQTQPRQVTPWRSKPRFPISGPAPSTKFTRLSSQARSRF